MCKGTLSPLESFSSELGTTFSVTFEANHVIDVQSQVFAASVPVGPSGVPINVTFKQSDTPLIQDEIGQVFSLCTPSDYLLGISSVCKYYSTWNFMLLSFVFSVREDEKSLGGTYNINI